MRQAGIDLFRQSAPFLDVTVWGSHQLKAIESNFIDNKVQEILGVI
jgi:hypothetical protein